MRGFYCVLHGTNTGNLFLAYCVYDRKKFPLVSICSSTSRERIIAIVERELLQ